MGVTDDREISAPGTAFRWLLGCDGSIRELALSFGAALFLIAFVVTGVSESSGSISPARG